MRLFCFLKSKALNIKKKNLELDTYFSVEACLKIEA